MENGMDLKFRQVFWAWQNYFIDTKTATKLLKCSKDNLDKKAVLFMTSSEYRDLYKAEFGLYMKDYAEKPIRGYTKFDKEVLHQFCEMGRRIPKERKNSLFEEWNLEKVTKACKENDTSILIYEDFYRYRLNFWNACHLIHDASVKFLKGPSYMKCLTGNLLYIEYLMKRNPETAENEFRKAKERGVTDQEYFFYVGYCLKTAKGKNVKPNDYYKVQKWLPFEIVVENLVNSDDEKKELFALIDKIKNNTEKEYVVIVASPKSLGRNKEEAVAMYSEILNIAHIVIAENPELSTINERYKVKVERGDSSKRDDLKNLFNEIFSKRKNKKTED